ncbi:MAG TPA: DUF4406 domain-containing protein [Caproicibacter sp.]|nr:DUF4406 domain-containing protein [Caproicibacter sp.]
MLEKRNSEGYPDPTAYEALLRIELAAKASAFRPMVFICSPFAGDIAGNTEKARSYSRFAVTRNCIPVAPHLLFPQFMDDSDPYQRDLAIFMGLVLLSKCLELWVFGETVTAWMSVELAKAKQRDIRIRYFTEQLEEVDAP